MLIIAGGVVLGLVAFAVFGEEIGKLIGGALGLLIVLAFVALVVGGGFYLASLHR